MAQNRRNRLAPIVIVLVRGAKVPDENDLPTNLRPLSYRNAIPIRPDPDFRNDMAKLIAALEKALANTKQ